MQSADPADIVISLAGHDRDKAYVVLQANSSAARTADGKTRKLTKPKSKNLRHLSLGRPGSDELRKALGRGTATDRDIRRELAEFRSEAAMTEEGKQFVKR